MALGLLMAVVLVGGVACTSQSTPAPTGAPPTVAAPATAPATSAPATVPALSSPVIASPTRSFIAASPISGPGVASPVASPIGALGGATPVAVREKSGKGDVRRAAAATPESACDIYLSWLNDPQVKAALEKSALWPEIIAEAQKAAAGQSIDKALMQNDSKALENVSDALQETKSDPANRDSARLAGRAMNIASRIADGLATGTMDQQTVQSALTALQKVIADYDADRTAHLARCGTPIAPPVAATPVAVS
jgi:hypothetical protein